MKTKLCPALAFHFIRRFTVPRGALILLAGAGLSAAYTASAQGPFLWAKRVASNARLLSNEPDVGLVLDSQDNCYVAGFFDATNNFGGITLTNQSASGSDIFVAKYDAIGALQWAQRAGGTFLNHGRGLGVDTNGNVYVTGGFYGPAEFGSINLPGSGFQDFFLAKYNNAGQVQWVQPSSGGTGAYGIGLAVDGAGNSYALAYLDGSPGGTTITFGTVDVPIPSNYGESTIVVKYDNTGTALWAQLLGGSGEVYATKAAVDGAGNVYVRGTFSSTLTIGSSTMVVSAGSSKNMFIARFSSSGALTWVQQPGGGNVDEGGVAVDEAENVYVSGSFDGTLNLGGGISLTSAGAFDAFVAKYNSSGAIQWARKAGGGMTSGALVGWYVDVALDGQGNAYGAGLLNSNAVAAKYDPAGTLQWTYSASGPPASPVASIVGKCAVDSGGHCYLAGWYQGTAAFGTTLLQPQGNWNFFLAELAPANPRSGSLQVTLSPTSVISAGARWQVDSGTNESSGATVTGLSVGSHAVSFTAVPNWTSPAAQTVNITSNHTAVITGVYTQQNPPVITTQPAAITKLQGQVAGFSVTAGGLGLNYQWYGVTGPIVGATARGYTNLAVNLGDAGNYCVVVTNSIGSVTSAVARLTVKVDTNKPTVTITSPKNLFETNVSTIHVAGTATTAGGRVSVVGVSVNGGGVAAASVTNATPASVTWGLAVNNLVPGTNLVAVYATSFAGTNSARVTDRYFFRVLQTLTVHTNAQGTLKAAAGLPAPPTNGARLYVGRNYAISAAGKGGFGFTNWTGGTSLPLSIVTNGPTIQFLMQTNLMLQANFVDTNQPTVSITAPTANQYCSNAVFTVKGTASDNVAVSNVWYQLNGTGWDMASITNHGTNWTAQVTLTPGKNQVQAYAVDTSGNLSPTKSVSFTYVQTFALADYYPLPLGAQWLYVGTGSGSNPAYVQYQVESTNYSLTLYTGGSRARSYHTNCVEMAAAYLDADMVPYDNWDEYWSASAPRICSYGFDDLTDLPKESFRFDGGVGFPAQMTVGASATAKTGDYSFGTNVGTMSLTLQLLEHTSLTVPAGSFPDVLHLRWSSSGGGKTQTFDLWWARAVGMIKKLGISGTSANWVLTNYSMPLSPDLAANRSLAQPPQQPVIEVSSGSLGSSASQFEFQFRGRPGQVVVVEASTDLNQWQPLQTNILSSSASYFCDPGWKDYSRRFYRIRSP